jgi:hypothetical protein
MGCGGHSWPSLGGQPRTPKVGLQIDQPDGRVPGIRVTGCVEEPYSRERKR